MMANLQAFWRRPRGFAIDVLPALVYLLALFAAGLMPLKSLPGPDFHLADKVWHFLAFAGLAVLLARALGHFGRALPQSIRDAALASAALGGLLEVLQSLTAFRAAEWTDFAADAAGALAAYLVLRRL
jgi:VanZ family protein